MVPDLRIPWFWTYSGSCGRVLCAAHGKNIYWDLVLGFGFWVLGLARHSKKGSGQGLLCCDDGRRSARCFPCPFEDNVGSLSKSSAHGERRGFVWLPKNISTWLVSCKARRKDMWFAVLLCLSCTEIRERVCFMLILPDLPLRPQNCIVLRRGDSCCSMR